MATPIVGRDEQLARVHALLDDEESTMRALILDGEAGIGKTTIWRTGVAAARSTPITVLAAQPGQAESTLPYAALGDLLQPLLDGHLERLPEAQRVALEVALQLRPADRAPEELAVARACLELVAGTNGDVLLAVDDVQWLDPPSARVLEFAVRRLGASPIRLLIARRSEHALPAPFGLDRVLEPDRLDARRLGPLTLGELGDLVRQRFGIRLLRPRLAELRESSGGNPFYALEIMRTTSQDGFHAPKSLTAALAARLSALPAQAREAALLASAAVRPTISLVVGAAGTNDGLAFRPPRPRCWCWKASDSASPIRYSQPSPTTPRPRGDAAPPISGSRRCPRVRSAHGTWLGGRMGPTRRSPPSSRRQQRQLRLAAGSTPPQRSPSTRPG